MNDDLYYQQLRREYERGLDEDYRNWRQRHGPGPDRPNVAQSVGRAIAGIVTDSAEAAPASGNSPSDVGGVYSRQTRS